MESQPKLKRVSNESLSHESSHSEPISFNKNSSNLIVNQKEVPQYGHSEKRIEKD